MRQLRLAAALLCAAVVQARAQSVERSEPFDSAGRVMAITPSIAARLQLVPPAWRVTGQFIEARLFSSYDSSFVMVVSRQGGIVERYAISPDERSYLRERVNTLPSSFRGSTPQIAEARGDRRRFIRNQTILGLGVYGPAAAVALSDDGAGQSAIYLLVAGGTYFGAATLSREIAISEQMTNLSTHMATRGALMGLGAMYVAEANGDGRAAGIFATSLLGTATGLRLARKWTPGETRSAGFGADVSAIMMYGVLAATDPDIQTEEDLTSDQGDDISRAQVGALVVAGAAGYPLGLMYARRASYNITSGDIGTLWVSGIIGAFATTPFLVNSPGAAQLGVSLMTLGFASGLVAGDRIFVRRADHSTGEATLITLGAVAGGLMGGGVYVLVDRDTRHPALGLALGTIGAIGGVWATELAFPPEGDAGRTASRFKLNPTGALLAASGVRGTFPVARFTF